MKKHKAKHGDCSYRAYFLKGKEVPKFEQEFDEKQVSCTKIEPTNPEDIGKWAIVLDNILTYFSILGIRIPHLDALFQKCVHFYICNTH